MAFEVSYEIYPAIGIARVGPSDEWFPGPEPALDDQLFFDQSLPIVRPGRTTPPASYRDATPQNLLKRQAARFRVFECKRDPTGKALQEARELKPKEAQITWSVHLANRKAAARNFSASGFRNPSVPAADREAKLVIDGGLQEVTATAAGQQIIKGKFNGGPADIVLGEVWTENNRLLVLGGRGISDGPMPQPPDELAFANNDGWHDDTSDGLVTASIELWDEQTKQWEPVAGSKIVPAWVIVGPFDFAPQIESYITLYDVAYQAAIDKGLSNLPGLTAYPLNAAETVYTRDVLPLLQRVRGYRWVNGPTMRAETQDRHRWSTAERIVQLGLPADATGKQWRRALVSHLTEPPMLPPTLREPTRQVRQVAVPRLHSHEPYTDPPQQNATNVLPLTPLQYLHLRNWANDQFITDGAASEEFLCDALTRVALEACSGGAFYPGMEAPRNMRGRVQDPALTKDVYHDSLPFRIDSTTVKPGEMTADLAVPWQADFYECRMERDNAWWPATRPDHVLISKPGKRVDSLSDEMYIWSESVGNHEDMVAEWHRLGIVKRTRVPDSEVPTDAAQLTEFRKTNYDEVQEGAVTGYYYYIENEREFPPHQEKSSGH